MKLNEVNGFYNPEDDEFHQAEKLDTRRPKLSLEHLNKLRKMREIRKVEDDDRKEFFKVIYSRPVQ